VTLVVGEQNNVQGLEEVRSVRRQPNWFDIQGIHQGELLISMITAAVAHYDIYRKLWPFEVSATSWRARAALSASVTHSQSPRARLNGATENQAATGARKSQVSQSLLGRPSRREVQPSA
jgi:hypothetical protein